MTHTDVRRPLLAGVEVRQGDPFGETGSLTRGFGGATDGGVQPPSTEVVLTSLQLSEGGDKIRRSEGGKRADANMDRDYRALQWGRSVRVDCAGGLDYGAELCGAATIFELGGRHDWRASFLPFQEVLVARDDGVDIVSSRECDEVVVARVTCLGLDLVGVVDQIDDRLDRVNEQRRVLETDPLAETRTGREDLANLAEEFRAHHDLELSATTQPRLDDSMRCTALDGGGHEHVRIDDDQHG
jgi:hypothetical protein